MRMRQSILTPTVMHQVRRMRPMTADERAAVKAKVEAARQEMEAAGGVFLPPSASANLVSIGPKVRAPASIRQLTAVGAEVRQHLSYQAWYATADLAASSQGTDRSSPNVKSGTFTGALYNELAHALGAWESE